MRDLLFSQRVTRDFPLNFRDGYYHLKLHVEAETLKIESYDTNFLSFSLVPRPLISSGQMIIYMILVNVVDILYNFSVMRDRLKNNRRDA